MADLLTTEPQGALSKIPNLLQYQQGNDVAAPPEGYEQITNPLNPLLRSASRLAHFTDGVYDTSPESHLIRLLKVLLGESGVGGVQRSMLLVRLQQAMGGTHFFDLDAFYGKIFGARRRSDELLGADPYIEVLPHSDWDEIRLRDGSYRARVSRLSTAIHLGATSGGIEAVAEALTGVEFDLVESWMYGSYNQYTWDDWEAHTWDYMESYTWDELEFSDEAPGERARNLITLYPYQPLSEGERFDLERAIDRIKPAHMIVLVSEDVVDFEIIDIPFRPSSPSEKWEIRQLVQNTRINGILPYPDYAENEFIEPPQVAFGGYSGEAWTALDKSPRSLAYFTLGPVSTTMQVDTVAVDMPPQALLSTSGTTQATSLPEFALKPIQGLYSGRSVSDGVIVSNPYEFRPGGQTGLYVDKVPAEYVEDQITSSTKIGQRFWTTPSRDRASGVNEILEIRFDEPVGINQIVFEYAKFPCEITAQAWDRGSGTWVTISLTRNRLSSPYGIGNTPPPDALHPYHYGAEHWEKAKITFDPITSRAFRFVCVRIDGQGPVGVNGTTIPYPLGLRNVDLGYRVDQISKIPHVPATSPVASSRNILGLQSRYYLTRDIAANVADSRANTSWICEPQPIADAVVNLYLSVGANGIPQVLNQLYIDPVYSGVVCNLYYTSRFPAGNENALPADDVIVPEFVVGSPIPVAGGAGGLRLVQNDPGSIVIDGRPMGGDGLSGVWWMGLEWEPISGDVADSKIRPLIASSMSGIPFFLAHCVSVSNEEYVIFLQVNGRLVRVVFTDYLPGPGQIVRALIQVNSQGDPVLRVVAGGTTQISTEWDPAKFEDGDYSVPLDYDFASTFDPVRYEYPEGYGMQRARTAPIYANASDFNPPSLTWGNSGSGGSQYAIDYGDASFHSVFQPYMRIPGTNRNFLEFNTFAADDIAGDISVVGRFMLDDWSSLDRYGNNQVLASCWGTAADPVAQCSWRLSVGPTGFPIFQSSPNGTEASALTFTGTVAIPTANGEFTYFAVTHDVNNVGASNDVRFWLSLDGVFWEQLGTTVTQAGVHTRFVGTAQIRVGGRGNGTLGLMRGGVDYFAVTNDIGAGGKVGTGIIATFDRDDILSIWNWTGTDPTFAASGKTVTIKRSPGTSSTIEDNSVTKLLLRDTFTEATAMEIIGTESVNVGITDAMQYKTLHVLFDGIIEDTSAVGEFLPIVTKKFNEDDVSAGWGIYSENNKLHFLISDGGDQASLTLTVSSPNVIRGRNVVISVVTNTVGDMTFSVLLRDGGVTLSDTILAVDVPTGSIFNGETIQIFSDASDQTNIGSISTVIIDTTPMSQVIDDSLIDAFSLGVDIAAVGSSWVVERDGVFGDLTLYKGDTLFPVHNNPMPVWGSTDETMPEVGYVVVPAGHIAWGSGASIGSDIKLTQAAVGFGTMKLPFLDNPTPYCLIPQSNVHTAAGTFLRYHWDYIGWTDGDTPSIGFMGGSPDVWVTAEWKPIGQFTLSKGVNTFQDVPAVGLKLEFTGLVAEPYESFLPMNRTVNRFAQRPVEAQGRGRDNVAQTTIDLLTANRFPDAVRGVFFEQDERINYVSPTSGVSVIDGTMRDAIGQRFGFGFNMAAWQPRYRSQLQQYAGIHEYNVTEVQATSRTAFFVGVRTVEVRRAKRNGLSDTKTYEDTLLNADYLDKPTVTLEVEPGQMFTPEFSASSLMTNARGATSIPFYSRRPVTAIQFATQQTGPAQVIPDDEFRSTGLTSYEFEDPDQWHKSGDAIIFWDANQGAVRVSRNPSVLDAFYAPDTPIVHPPISPVLSSGFGHLVQLDFDSFGGISSPTVSTSPTGVFYAGARCSAYNELSAPLWLRIYGSDGTTLLAEKDFTPKVGVPTECVLPYTLGNVPDLDDGIQVRVEQDGPYMDSWFMHALSGFDTSILWEFSNDDGVSWVPGYAALNLRYGVVDFPQPGTALRWRVVAYRHNAVIDAIRMRPWYQTRLGAAL